MILDQQDFYSGYKQKYGYKYQVLITSDGLISNMIRLFISRKSDLAIVEQSGLVEKLWAVIEA